MDEKCRNFTTSSSCRPELLAFFSYIVPFDNEKDDLLKNSFSPPEPLIDPLPITKKEPLFKTPEPIISEPKIPPPIMDKPDFSPPGNEPGIIRGFEHEDRGIRFSRDGIMTDHSGGTIGSLENDRILDLEGNQIGQIGNDGKIHSNHPSLHNTYFEPFGPKIKTHL